MDFVIDKTSVLQAGFTEGENGCFYINIGGFLYTASYGKKHLLLAVNLPAVNRNERRMISCYIKESAVLLDRKKFMRDGIYLYFDRKLSTAEELDYLCEFARQLSSFLTSTGVEFSNAELNISFHKKMYVFKPIAEPITAECEKCENVLPKEENPEGFKRFTMSFECVIALLVLCGILFFVLLINYIKIASAVGYVTGWLICFLLCEQKKNHIFWRSMALSSVMLIAVGFTAFIVLFLSQSEFYSVFDYSVRSLDLYHCIFSTLLGLVLAAFGIYSTVPPKNSEKKTVHDDF